MLKLIKFSIVFSMIFNPLSIVVSVLTTVFWGTPVVFLVLTCIYATVISWSVGVFALKKLNTAKTKKELKPMAILTVIGNNPLAGILMLVIKDKDLMEVDHKDLAKVDQKDL